MYSSFFILFNYLIFGPHLTAEWSVWEGTGGLYAVLGIKSGSIVLQSKQPTPCRLAPFYMYIVLLRKKNIHPNYQ